VESCISTRMALLRFHIVLFVFCLFDAIALASNYRDIREIFDSSTLPTSIEVARGQNGLNWLFFRIFEKARGKEDRFFAIFTFVDDKKNIRHYIIQKFHRRKLKKQIGSYEEPSHFENLVVYENDELGMQIAYGGEFHVHALHGMWADEGKSYQGTINIRKPQNISARTFKRLDQLRFWRLDKSLVVLAELESNEFLYRLQSPTDCPSALVPKNFLSPQLLPMPDLPPWNELTWS